MEFVQYNFGHDEWHNSTHALKKYLWSRQGEVYYRSPVSFGPMISPRQDHYGKPLNSRDSKFSTYSIRFKTSATYLKTLFPSSQFSFASPGTFAEATYECTELKNMRWLGGGGYHFLGLWVHGVQYTKKDGTKLFGSFLPVLFESLPDAVTTGREELGMPKLYCDIDSTRGDTTAIINCGWRGSNFLTLRLENLHGNTPTGSTSPIEPDIGQNNFTPNNGTFVHRYVPSVGKRNLADAEYPVFIDNSKSATLRVVETTNMASCSKIDVRDGDQHSLPTLHHIVAGLREIPVYDIIHGKIEEGRGVSDLSHAERIE
jgi:hypothetical protein